jgi:hypothetical protein
MLVLTGNNSLTKLANSHMFFPGILRDLIFDSIDGELVHPYISAINREINGFSGESAALMQILFGLASKFSL